MGSSQLTKGFGLDDLPKPPNSDDGITPSCMKPEKGLLLNFNNNTLVVIFEHISKYSVVLRLGKAEEIFIFVSILCPSYRQEHTALGRDLCQYLVEFAKSPE